MILGRRIRLTIVTKPDAFLSVSLDVDASAADLFRHLSRPASHVAIDGSGMLRGSGDGRVSGVGDVFEMRMFNDVLGEYVMQNHVVEFVPDRRIAWEPVLKAAEKEGYQHLVGQRSRLRWCWELSPRPEGGTRVTEIYDLSDAPEWLHEATREGEDWRPAMEASLANLAGLAGRPD